MKILVLKFIWILTFVTPLFVGAQANLSSTFNPSIAAYGSLGDSLNQKPFANYGALDNGINCDTNSFYAINSSGDISQFSLNGNVISYTSTLQTGVKTFSIAICNNLNGGGFSPTLYGDYYTRAFNLFAPSYYDGSNWINTSITDPNLNCGGYGDYLYYSAPLSNVVHQKINKYDGVNMTTVYSDSSCNIFTGDLAVDKHGNIWFPITYDSTMFINTLSDSIRVISPSGQLIKSFPFKYNLYHAYGSFYLNDMLYIGLGASNIHNPNTLLPISFSSDSAIAGTPIPMPIESLLSLDLAVCDQSFSVANNDHEHTVDHSIFPNPTTGNISIELSEFKHGVTATLRNSLGQIVLLKKFQLTNLLKLNITAPRGIYFLQLETEDGQIQTLKVLKE